MVITPLIINPSASPLKTEAIVLQKNIKIRQLRITIPVLPIPELAKQKLSAMKANIASKVNFLFIFTTFSLFLIIL